MGEKRNIRQFLSLGVIFPIETSPTTFTQLKKEVNSRKSVSTNFLVHIKHIMQLYHMYIFWAWESKMLKGENIPDEVNKMC